MQVHDVLSGLDCMKRERPTGTQRLCFAHVSFFLGGGGGNFVCLFGDDVRFMQLRSY